MQLELEAHESAPPPPPLNRWQRLPGYRIDAVSALTLFLIISFCIPAPLIFNPVGGSGTPGNLLGIAFLFWWVLAKLGSGLGVARGRQPIRIALFFLLLTVLISAVPLFLRPRISAEVTGIGRGLMLIAALSGVALLAADGITSMKRAHVLMKRVLDGAFFVALTGIGQFLTGFNPGRDISIPGLTRNIIVSDQDRSNFTRVQGTTLHPIEFGTLMGMLLPIAVHFAFMAKGRRSRQFAWLRVGAMTVGLAFAITRTGIIVAGIGMLFIAAEWTWRRRLQVAAMAMVMIAAMRLAIPGLIGTLTAMFTKLNQDNSTQGRTADYAIAGKLFGARPWFGRGFATLFPATQKIFDNGWLSIAIELGIIGIVAFAIFFFIITFTARGIRLRCTDLETHGLAQGLVGSFVGVAVAFATADLMSFTMLMGVFFLNIGITGALWRLTGGPTGVKPQPRRAYRSWKPGSNVQRQKGDPGSDALEPSGEFVA